MPPQHTRTLLRLWMGQATRRNLLDLLGREVLHMLHRGICRVSQLSLGRCGPARATRPWASLLGSALSMKRRKSNKRRVEFVAILD